MPIDRATKVPTDESTKVQPLITGSDIFMKIAQPTLPQTSAKPGFSGPTWTAQPVAAKSNVIAIDVDNRIRQRSDRCLREEFIV